MLRELFSSKSLIAALIGCGLLIVGIHFWSQHEHSKLRRAEAETRRFIQQVEAEKQAATMHAEEPSIVPQSREVTSDTQAAPDDFAKATDDGISEVDDARNTIEVGALVEEELVAQEAQATPLRTSPFGFGVYPDIPSGYPEPDAWDVIEEIGLTNPESARDYELMERVRIKLWNQGLHTAGIVYKKSDNGLIYPLYPNIAYIQWDVWETPEGILERYPARVLGGPGVGGYEEDFAEGIIPPHLTVIDYEEAGIDPYQFLDLQH